MRKQNQENVPNQGTPEVANQGALKVASNK